MIGASLWRPLWQESPQHKFNGLKTPTPLGCSTLRSRRGTYCHLVVFSSDETERAPINAQLLAVGLGRGRQTDAQLVNELLAAIELGLLLKRRLMWLMVTDAVSDEVKRTRIKLSSWGVDAYLRLKSRRKVHLTSVS
jgi:hypothetical protein